jgi:ATP-binding cassette subfamily B protein
MKLLLRLYDADSGAIEINGLPLGDYDIHRLRERIGIALQKPAVYSLSLRENIEAYRRASDAEIGDILKKTGLDAVLKKNGADVGSVLTREFDDKGVVLSGGEAQRLAIARVLCGDFGLLLDEPSSALDPLAEYELTKLIFDSSNKATTVLIAHRLSTVRDADGSMCSTAGRS